MSKLILNYVISRALDRLKIGSYAKNGRNFFGRICVHHRGAGLKHGYRLLDFHRKLNLFGIVYKIVYDPNRSAFVGLIFYTNGLFSMIILTDNLILGSTIFSGLFFKKNKFISLGSSLQLKYIPVFSVVNNIEINKHKGATLCRAAGTSALIIAKNLNSVTLKLKSGWLLNVSDQCVASIGFTSNILHNMNNLVKAGKNRGLGVRPTVRGVAMNPCDHPHGGGNGKTSPPRAPVTPWGKITKWHHTKNKKVDKLKRKLFKKVR